MPPPPKPDVVAHDLHRIVDLAAHLAEQFPWLYSLAYNRPHGDDVHVTQSGHGDPTAGVVTNEQMQRTRHRTRAAADAIGKAFRNLQEAESALAKELGRGEGVLVLPDEEPISELVDRAEMRRLRDAQRRRRARGERCA